MPFNQAGNPPHWCRSFGYIFCRRTSATGGVATVGQYYFCVLCVPLWCDGSPAFVALLAFSEVSASYSNQIVGVGQRTNTAWLSESIKRFCYSLFDVWFGLAGESEKPHAREIFSHLAKCRQFNLSHQMQIVGLFIYLNLQTMFFPKQSLNLKQSSWLHFSLVDLWSVTTWCEKNRQVCFPIRP